MQDLSILFHCRDQNRLYGFNQVKKQLCIRNISHEANWVLGPTVCGDVSEVQALDMFVKRTKPASFIIMDHFLR